MTVEIICADARTALAEMPKGSVYCAITSPPYWSLRDYGLEPVVWGEPVEPCEHEWGEESYQRRSNDGGEPDRKQETNVGAVGQDEPVHHAFCRRCSAWRGSLGLEPTPELYVEHIVQVMRAVRRVLRDDGTLWLNLGDSYASGKGTCYNPGGGDGSLGKQRKEAGAHPLNRGNVSVLRDSGLKPKDLVGVPWRVAFALQADGWYLRAEIIWAKLNPMPESVRDRPTRSHEQIFLFSKAPRYYYDAQAVAEPSDVTANLIQSEYEALHRLSEEPSAERLLPSSQQGQLFSDLQGLHEGQGHRMAGDGERPPEDPRGQPSVSPQRERQGSASAVGSQPTETHVHGRLPSQSPGQGGSTESEPISEGKDASGALLSVPEGQGGTGSQDAEPDGQGPAKPSIPQAADVDSGSERPDGSGLDRHQGEASESVLLLPAGDTKVDDGSPAAPEQWRAARQGEHRPSLPELQFKEAKQASASRPSRNLRSVWTIATQPYPGAHFACFPEKLVEPCILAGTSEWGCCPDCGAPWERVVEKGELREHPAREGRSVRNVAFDGDGYSDSGGTLGLTREAETTGWRPTCDHEAEPVPCRVLDPFSGSGTVGLVAERLGRHSVLIDASEDYCRMARERTAQMGLMI